MPYPILSPLKSPLIFFKKMCVFYKQCIFDIKKSNYDCLTYYCKGGDADAIE